MIDMKSVKNVTLGGKNVIKISKQDGTVLWSSKKWYEDEAYLKSLTSADVGTEQEVEVNGVVHKVRLIGVDHDNLADGSGKAHTTWEFVDLLSDENGYSIATYWKNTNTSSGSNYDYLNSSIRKALDGEGSGDCHWFEKDSKTFSTKYTGSVLSMLPASLQAVLKSVTKVVATGSSYALTNYNTKLFQLSYREMTATGSSSYAKEEGTTYQYYKDNDDDASRIKHQIKWHDGARTETLSGTDLDGEYTGIKYSSAGYNNSTENYGGMYWLRSPGTFNSYDAWICGNDGYLYSNYVFNIAYAVSPAFCI